MKFYYIKVNLKIPKKCFTLKFAIFWETDTLNLEFYVAQPREQTNKMKNFSRNQSNVLIALSLPSYTTKSMTIGSGNLTKT